MKPLNKLIEKSNQTVEWDETTKQYRLTLAYCKDAFDSNFRDDEVLRRRIKKNSSIIYRWIHNHIHSRNRTVVDFVLNNTVEGRELITNMLTAQMEADIETAYNDLSSTPAVNVSSGQVIDRNELRRNQICVDAEQEFENSADYVGFNLGYQAMYPYNYFVLFR